MNRTFGAVKAALRFVWTSFLVVTNLLMILALLFLPLILPYWLLVSYAIALPIVIVLAILTVQITKRDAEFSRRWRIVALVMTPIYIVGVGVFMRNAVRDFGGVRAAATRVVQGLRIQKSITDRGYLAKYDSIALTSNYASLKAREYFSLPLGPVYNVLNFRVHPFRESEISFLFDEIFVSESYYFTAKNPAPVIMDCGSNIGMSVLYFKHLYPEARVTAFEPDPRTAKILRQNIQTNSLSGVEVVEKALSDTIGTIAFTIAASSLVSSSYRGEGETIVEVPTVLLSNYINSNVDLVKIDVEGAEGPIIKDLIDQDKLRFIDQMLVEWHHNVERPVMTLGEFLGALEKQEFNYQLSAPIPDRFEPNTFQDILIFAYKTNAKASSDPVGRSSDGENDK